MTGRARQLFSWCGSRIGEREALDALSKETYAGLGYRGTNLQKNYRKGPQRLRSLKNAVFAGGFEQWTFTPYVALSRTQIALELVPAGGAFAHILRASMAFTFTTLYCE